MEVTHSLLFTALGMAGCACYVASYFLVQLGLMDGNDYAYVLMNFIASVLMLLSLTHSFNLGAAILQVMWIVISVIGMVRKHGRTKVINA